ncbi:glycosyltransferase family 1 protein [Mucilaginibacter sp. L196]|uniref:glycosyltransferase family 4 protein n=1 Tax=Mucilaginibacter sp. L196 TaxID=1641870 RepID=UPI00131BD405|nr:glycosyltransferase family 1 protein [Mucilaginibacter sp. L196]
MKIGYDAKRAFLNNTGLGNYSRWLVKALAQHHPENTYYLYTPKVKPNPRLNFLQQFSNIKTVTPVGKLIKSWWRSKGIVEDLQRDAIDIYHGLSHELPIGIGESGIKSVVTVHDLIFMRFPEQFGRVSRSIYRLKVTKACAVTDKIIAISKKTKDDLVELLNVDPTKIKVIYQGCDPIFKIEQSAEQKKAVAEKYNLPADFILSVGTIEERKNLLLLVKALPTIENEIPLVVVGKSTKYLKLVKEYLSTNNLSNRVIFLHGVEFADLPAIYQLAKIFVYPSRYEGFGIPVLEAITCGTPVIAAKGSCLEEAGGDSSAYVDPNDPIDLADKLNAVISNEQLRKKMITKGKEYSLNFEDAKLANQLMQLYKSL